ncbi:MAG: hypothetical protein KIT54_04495 [Phycisphaeraceae bacterium]|nr:hypothetical protein [Phycisphaeraceae bacterium]
MASFVRILGIAALAWLAAGGGACKPVAMPTGTITIDTVTFVLDPPAPAASASSPAAGGPAPGIWIDTHIKATNPIGLGAASGSVTSRRPYDIAFDFTDNAASDADRFARLEITSVQITYDDGAAEPAAEALQVPIVVRPRAYETVNSVSGGRVVRSTLSLLSGTIPGVVTRDESFRLEIEGRFVGRDGTAVPFAIDQRWRAQREQTTKTAAEVYRDG